MLMKKPRKQHFICNTLKHHLVLVLRNRELPEKDLDKDFFPSNIFTPAGAHFCGHSRLAELLQVLGKTTGTSEEGPRFQWWNGWDGNPGRPPMWSKYDDIDDIFHSRRLDPPTLCCWEGTRFDPERRACEDDPDVRWNKAVAGSKCFREMDAKLIHKIYWRHEWRMAIFEDDPLSQERCSSGRATPCSGRESPKGRTGTGIWEDFRDMAILDQHVGVECRFRFTIRFYGSVWVSSYVLMAFCFATLWPTYNDHVFRISVSDFRSNRSSIQHFTL